MEKSKRIDAATMIDAVNKIAETTASFEWNGIEVVVNRVLPMQNMMEFVDYVVKTCFGDDGEYIPEVKDLAIKSCLLEMYANFDLPKDLSERYAVIYNSDIVDITINHIDGRQFGEIINAIESKISNLAQANVQMVYAQMNQINKDFDNLLNSISGIFDGVNTEDMASLVKSISNGDIDEGKLVQALVYQDKNEKVVQMPNGDK